MKIKITQAIQYVVNQQIDCVPMACCPPQWAPVLNTVANSADASQSSDVSLWSLSGCPWPFQHQGLMVAVAHMHRGANLCSVKEHGCPPADGEQCPPFPNPSDYA